MVTFDDVALPHVLDVGITKSWVTTQIPIPGATIAYRTDFSSLGRTVTLTGEIRETTVADARAWIEQLRTWNDGVARDLDLEDGTAAFSVKLVDPIYDLLVGNWFPGKYNVPYSITLVESA